MEKYSCDCEKYISKGNNLKLAYTNKIFDIYGDLNKGEVIIIKYFGNLLEKENDKIFLNYGFGNLWTDKNVIELNSCTHSDKKCYCASFELLHTENLFLCFMDSNNNWDLENNSSYTVEIGDSLTTLTKTIVDITIPEEEYMNKFEIFFKKLSNKLLNMFLKIGTIFEKKLN